MDFCNGWFSNSPSHVDSDWAIVVALKEMSCFFIFGVRAKMASPHRHLTTHSRLNYVPVLKFYGANHQQSLGTQPSFLVFRNTLKLLEQLVWYPYWYGQYTGNNDWHGNGEWGNLWNVNWYEGEYGILECWNSGLRRSRKLVYIGCCCHDCQ